MNLILGLKTKTWTRATIAGAISGVTTMCILTVLAVIIIVAVSLSRKKKRQCELYLIKN